MSRIFITGYSDGLGLRLGVPSLVEGAKLPETKRIAPQLVVRESTARVRKAK